MIVGDVPEWVPQERVENQISRGLNFSPTTAINIADVGTVGAGEGVESTQIWDSDESDDIPEGTIGELEQSPILEYEADSVTVTDGEVRFGYAISHRLRLSARQDVLARAVLLGTKKLAQRVDRDGLSIVSSFTNESDFNNTDLTEANFLVAAYAYEEQNPSKGSGTAFIAGPTQFLNWATNLGTVSGGGSAHWHAGDAESERIAQMMQGQSGYKGMRHGYALFQTQNLPVDGGDRHCAFLEMGETSPLIFRSWEPVTVEFEWVPGRKAHIAWISTRYGWGKARDAEGRLVILDN